MKQILAQEACQGWRKGGFSQNEGEKAYVFGSERVQMSVEQMVLDPFETVRACQRGFVRGDAALLLIL